MRTYESYLNLRTVLVSNFAHIMRIFMHIYIWLKYFIPQHTHLHTRFKKRDDAIKTDVCVCLKIGLIHSRVCVHVGGQNFDMMHYFGPLIITSMIICRSSKRKV